MNAIAFLGREITIAGIKRFNGSEEATATSLSSYNDIHGNSDSGADERRDASRTCAKIFSAARQLAVIN